MSARSRPKGEHWQAQPEGNPVRTMRHRPGQRGIGVIAVLVVLVVMAAMAAAVLRLGRQMHTTTSQDVQGLRATAAARSGIEYGLYLAFKGAWQTGCAGSSETLDLSTDLGMRVTVRCSVLDYSEGQRPNSVTGLAEPAPVQMITIDAVACNSSTVCPDPDSALRESYVERRRQVQAQSETP